MASSHGTATIDLATGKVLEAQIDKGGDPSTFTDVDRFDLEEYRAFYGREVEKDDHFDILDLGYWDKNGVYEPADAWFRQDVFRNQRDEALNSLAWFVEFANKHHDWTAREFPDDTAEGEWLCNAREILKRHGRMNG